METWFKISIILFLILIVLLIVFLLIKSRNNPRRWSCKEGGCERVIGGDYDSKDECEKQCKLKTLVPPEK